MREVSLLKIVKYEMIGITPACAGSIMEDLYMVNHSGDHPRVCGKYLSNLKKRGKNMGSPPRVREV